MSEDIEIDISPEMGGSAGRKKTIFQENEIAQIKENPRGLTKEGIEEEIRNWKHSANKHVVMKFEAMLKHCKNIVPSGKTPDGRIILSMNKQGIVTWAKGEPIKPKR